MLSRIGRRGIRHYQIGITEDHLQHIIKIMGDATCQPPHRFHFLGLTGLFFLFYLIGHIPFNRHIIDNLSCTIFHRRNRRIFGILRPVLLDIDQQSGPGFTALQRIPHLLIERSVVHPVLEDI
jgi:hypothetical protein